MRDAFGGAFSINLMLIFLVLYVSFICVALNYSRAFRVKNRIINIIEQQEGYTVGYENSAEDQIKTYLVNAGYNIQESQVNGTGISNKNVICNGCTFYQPGYSIAEVPTGAGNSYYYVETYMVFTLPVINVHIPIRIGGETRLIEIP